ncbi:metallophosphoesterase [Sedimentitalea sp.]|uniref:metallophosphoesterase family protein n=1 Tax=Sedimentitalea sp. TaxID=2048915 RepID=UPI0032997496
MTHFIHLTDLHVSHPDAHDPGQKTDPPDTLRRVVDIINAMPLQPDFIIASGDLTNLGDALSYGLLRDLLTPLHAPLIMALGNHDDRSGFHQVFNDVDTAAPYFRDGVYGGLHVITLDTGVPGHVAGTIEMAQFDYLTQALNRHVDVPKLLIMHHPPRIDPDGLPWASIDRASTDRLADTLCDQNVVGIMSGHIHINRVSHWHGIPIVTTNGLNSTVDLLETSDLRIVEGTGFGLCDWKPTGLSVSFVPLSPAAQELGVIDQARLRSFT